MKLGVELAVAVIYKEMIEFMIHCDNVNLPCSMGDLLLQYFIASHSCLLLRFLFEEKIAHTIVKM